MCSVWPPSSATKPEIFPDCVSTTLPMLAETELVAAAVVRMAVEVSVEVEFLSQAARLNVATATAAKMRGVLTIIIFSSSFIVALIVIASGAYACSRHGSERRSPILTTLPHFSSKTRRAIHLQMHWCPTRFMWWFRGVHRPDNYR